MLKNNGTLYTVKALKTMRLHCTRYICGSPLLVNKEGVGVDRSGWPTALAFLKPLLKEGLQGKKFLLTVLMLSRTLEPRKGEKLEPNYDSIQKPSIAKKYIIPRGAIRKFVLENNLKAAKPEFNVSDVFLSVKGSPSGKASLTATVSLLSLGYNQMQWIFDLTCLKGVDYFTAIYNFAWKKSTTSLAKKNYSGYTGQLALVKDPECKIRVIAMLDWTSQLFLRPIHNILLGLLKRIPMDRTYTQNPHAKWLDNNENFHSLDLSSATDRFPVRLQERLIEEIFGSSRFADAWKNLLVNRKFAYPDGQGHTEYAVGQPMGAYSSWAAFTLCHHFIVWYAAQLCGIHKFDQYIILGDDIVIKNDKVAKKYIDLMTKLGVELSPSKTHVSKNTYEFAKRWFQDGKEITGLPMRGIVQNVLNPFIVYIILFDFFKVKGNLYMGTGNLVSSLSRFYRGLKLWNGKKIISLSLRFMPRLKLYSAMLDFSFGFGTNEQYRQILGSCTVNNGDYNIPGPKEILTEMVRVLGLGLGSVVSANISKSMSIFDKIISRKADFNITDANEFKDVPIFTGIKNQVERYLQLVQDPAAMPVLELAENLCQLDIDAIFNKDRNKIMIQARVAEISMRGLNKLSKENDIMYGSSTTESTYTALDSMGNIVKSTMGLVSTNLNKIQNGTYQEAPSMADYLSAWGKWG
nr:MAG: putative RNA dependent RNA polymerase [Xinjiang mito-like virus 72]